eukprot:SAG22_NODE_74_length_22289_cov_65.265119_2_plen_246_part_00
MHNATNQSEFVTCLRTTTTQIVARRICHAALSLDCDSVCLSVGAGTLCKGIEQALPKLKVGGKCELRLSAEYGPGGDTPACGTVELVSFEQVTDLTPHATGGSGSGDSVAVESSGGGAGALLLRSVDKVRTTALPFYCAPTVFRSKTVPYRAVPLSQKGPDPLEFKTPKAFSVVKLHLTLSVKVSRKALPFCCAPTVFLSKTAPFRRCPSRPMPTTQLTLCAGRAGAGRTMRGAAAARGRHRRWS